MKCETQVNRLVSSVFALTLLAGGTHTAAQVTPAVVVQPAKPIAPASQVTPAVVIQPAQPVAPATGIKLSNEDLALLKEQYEKADEAGKSEMAEMLKAFGIDVKTLWANSDSQTSDPASPEETAKPQSIMQVLQGMDLSRTPQAVLSARSRLGFSSATKPDTADKDATGKWLFNQIMAGEWRIVGAFLRSADVGKEGPEIYGHILQSMNKGGRGDSGKSDPVLLPEEVLDLADATPEPLKDWQIDTLSQFLKSAAGRYSVAPMFQVLKTRPGQFGGADAESRARTVRFLVGADMIAEAYQFFPALEEARAAKNAEQLLNHAKYFEVMASSSRDESESTAQRRTAWGLYGEVTLLEGADPEKRQAAMARAIDLLPSMPPTDAATWISQVFANAGLAPAALEAVTLKAVELRKTELDETVRAQAILTLKQSVDALLSREGMDATSIKIPLRMMTTALVAEAEVALEEDQKQRGGPASKGMELLLQALPDSKWMSALESSLALRAYKASIGVAAAAQETDLALDYVAEAVKRFPADGEMLADHFLQVWQSKLSPAMPEGDEMGFRYYGFGRQALASAPLTRGRQRRDLDRLTRLMKVLNQQGVDPRRLPSVAAVFKSCHGETEIFTRKGIEAVFGPIVELSAETAASLSDQMRTGLSGDWRDRKVQQAAGNKRTPEEIRSMVEKGYELAIELIDRSIALKPDSWRFAISKAALAYDRLQYKQSEDKEDFAKFNEYRKVAFLAFEQTAARYADLVRAGQEREDITVFLVWFNAAVGATELNFLTREDLLVEGGPQDDQIDRIKASMSLLPSEAASRHIGEFARAIVGGAARMPPEVKPRVVRHAMRIIGDHPSGAPLRRLSDLYNDLVRDEVKLRLEIDGDEQIGAGKPFAATLSMRFTAAVDRETGGFSKYLQNEVWTFVGGQYRPMNHRDLLRKSIEETLAKSFDVDAIGFFEAFASPRPVVESGEDGWMEKPMVYMMLRAKDPSTDRLPQLTMDLTFNDVFGPVVLPLLSNAPTLDASKSSGVRPIRDLEIMQIVDARSAFGSKDPKITLEVLARGRGVVPELEDMMSGVRDAAAGFEIEEGGIEIKPISVLGSEGVGRSWSFGAVDPEKQAYVDRDDDGGYRLGVERQWVVTYTPGVNASADEFILPMIKDPTAGKLVSKTFVDMDVIDVSGPSVKLHAPLLSARTVVITGVISAVAIGVGMWALSRRRRKTAVDVGAIKEVRLTPLGVAMYLRRRADELSGERANSIREELVSFERDYFGRDAQTPDESKLRSLVDRWSD